MSDAEAYREQVAYLLQRSAFYRDKLAGLTPGGIEDIAGLPLTDKRELRATVTPVNPIGAHLCATPDEIARIYSTSGTTGAPSYIPLTAGDLEAYAVRWHPPVEAEPDRVARQPRHQQREGIAERHRAERHTVHRLRPERDLQALRRAGPRHGGAVPGRRLVLGGQPPGGSRRVEVARERLGADEERAVGHHDERDGGDGHEQVPHRRRIEHLLTGLHDRSSLEP